MRSTFSICNSILAVVLSLFQNESLSDYNDEDWSIIQTPNHPLRALMPMVNNSSRQLTKSQKSVAETLKPTKCSHCHVFDADW